MQTNWKYTQRFMLYFSSTRKKKKDEKFSSQFYTDNYSCRYDIICLALISAFWWLLVTRNFTLSISPSLSKSFTVFQLSFTITVHKRPMDHIATMNVEHWKPLVFFFNIFRGHHELFANLWWSPKRESGILTVINILRSFKPKATLAKLGVGRNKKLIWRKTFFFNVVNVYFHFCYHLFTLMAI